MTETGEYGRDGMFFADWLKEHMRMRGIESNAALARLLSDHLGREVSRSTVNPWMTKPRGVHSLEVEYINALAVVLTVPADAVALAEARARGVDIGTKAIICSSIPSWTDKIEPAVLTPWLDLLNQFGKALGHTK